MSYQSRHQLLKSIALPAFALLILFLATSSTAENNGPPGGHLNIESVKVVEGDPDILLITGVDFDFGGGPLHVDLGSVGGLVIASDTPTQIIAELPADLPPGDYLLNVYREGGQSQGDQYDLTIGLTKALADVCALYVMTDNIDKVPDYCCSLLAPTKSPVAYKSPGKYYFTVPAGVTSIWVDAEGANGGGFYNINNGRGALVASELSTTPCEILTVLVGGTGGAPSNGTTGTPGIGGNGGVGGFNGGGDGGRGGDCAESCKAGTGGYGGGGASEVRRGSDRLVVAGGGGGKGGGNGGNSGSAGGDGSDGITGGGAGSGGSGGSAGTSTGTSKGNSGDGTNGGAGGDGGFNPLVNGYGYDGGGGGGGGYGGGGGGGGGAGGGVYGGGGGGGGSLGDSVTDGFNSDSDGEVWISF